MILAVCETNTETFGGHLTACVLAAPLTYPSRAGGAQQGGSVYDDWVVFGIFTVYHEYALEAW